MAGSPCVIAGTNLEELNVCKENSAGIVIWRTRIFPRYKKAERTPITDAWTALWLQRWTAADPIPAHAATLSWVAVSV